MGKGSWVLKNFNPGAIVTWVSIFLLGYKIQYKISNQPHQWTKIIMFQIYAAITYALALTKVQSYPACVEIYGEL